VCVWSAKYIYWSTSFDLLLYHFCCHMSKTFRFRLSFDGHILLCILIFFVNYIFACLRTNDFFKYINLPFDQKDAKTTLTFFSRNIMLCHVNTLSVCIHFTMWRAIWYTDITRYHTVRPRTYPCILYSDVNIKDLFQESPFFYSCHIWNNEINKSIFIYIYIVFLRKQNFIQMIYFFVSLWGTSFLRGPK